MSNILIIDDEKLMCDTLASIIKQMGHVAACAHSIADGRKRVASGLYDIVLLDVGLPDGSGLDLLPEIRKMPSVSEVIIITSVGDPDGAELAIKNGAWDYIEKPFSKQVIQLAIARALEISSAQVLILDEPTSSLDAHETEQIFRVMEKLKANGVGIIFITHFIDQVYAVSDRITVLRNGMLVGTFDTKSLPRLELIAKMIGRSLSDYDDMTATKLAASKLIKEEALFQAKELGLTGSIKPFDLDLHAAGEVLVDEV